MSAEVFQFLRFADHEESGHLPMGGGVLAQTAAFNAGLRLLRSEEAHCRAQAMKK